MMQKISQATARISKFLQKIEMLLGCICLFSLLAIMLVNVFMRYVLAKPLIWSDEVNNFLFVWFALLGVAYIMGNDGHLRVNSLVNKLPNKAKTAVSLLMNAVMFFMFAVFAFACVRLLSMVTFSGILRIPLKYIYVILPISFGLMCFHLINNMLQSVWPNQVVEQASAVESGEGE